MKFLTESTKGFVIASLVLIAWTPRFEGMQTAHADTSGDWLQFRGTNGSGRSDSVESLNSTFDLKSQLVWKKSILPGQSSPIVVGKKVVFTGFENHLLSTVCISMEDGAILWKRDIEVSEFEKFHPQHGPASPTPVSDGKNVYVVFGSVGVIAYDGEGNELWKKTLIQTKNMFGTASSPVLMDNSLLVQAGTEVESLLIAIDKNSGETKWERRRPGPASAWSTPTRWQYDDKPIVLFYEPFHLRACFLADGNDAWSVPGLADEPVTVPQTTDNRVIVTSYNLKTNREALGLPTFAALIEECDRDKDGAISVQEAKANKSILSRPEADGQGDHPLRMFVRLLDADKDGYIREDEWPRIHSWIDPWEHANGVIAIESPKADGSPTKAWQHTENVPECPTPLIWKDRIYFIRNGGVVSCLNLETGNCIYSERLAGGGPYYASPITADNKLFVASARGQLTMLATGDSSKTLGSIDLGEPIWATPAIVGSRLVVRSEKTMWLLNLSATQEN